MGHPNSCLPLADTMNLGDHETEINVEPLEDPVPAETPAVDPPAVPAPDKTPDVAIPA